MAPLVYSMDWTHKGGTRIFAKIQIEPGNNDSQTDIKLMFEKFCDDMRDTLLVKQDDDPDT
jgi:hypothetical protein